MDFDRKSKGGGDGHTAFVRIFAGMPVVNNDLFFNVVRALNSDANAREWPLLCG
jgi:hypothetical protein